MKSIAVIMFHFGTLPKWINYLLASCKANNSIDFFFFTDSKEKLKEYKNIQVVNMSFQEFSDLATKKLKANIQITRPYKLCDLKPAFGAIFEDYVKDYNFWGHLDTDIILGDIRSFITPDLTQNYDIISTKKEYISGYFSLYRNCKEVNYLFSKNKDYVQIFNDNDKSYYFDEAGDATGALIQGKNIDSIESEIESMTHMAFNNKELRIYLDQLGYENSRLLERATDFRLLFSKGILNDINKSKPLLLYHFRVEKRLPSFYILNYKDSYESSFFISNEGIWQHMNLEFKISRKLYYLKSLFNSPKKHFERLNKWIEMYGVFGLIKRKLGL